MAQITKGVRIRVSPRKYEWFEVWTEAKIDVDQITHEAHRDLFQQAKQECISDAQEVLRHLNLPDIDVNILSSLQSHSYENISNIDSAQYNLSGPDYSAEGGLSASVEKYSSVPSSTPQEAGYNQDYDPALDIEANIPIHGFVNRIPDIG